MRPNRTGQKHQVPLLEAEWSQQGLEEVQAAIEHGQSFGEHRRRPALHANWPTVAENDHRGVWNLKQDEQRWAESRFSLTFIAEATADEEA